MVKRNIKLTISYDGTNYYGWQKQPNMKTIQGEIEKAIYKIFNCQVDLIGSGRTDAGVHAIEQTANFQINSEINPDKIKVALNSKLPQQIRINESKEVDENFHSRYDAVGKTYIYQIYNNRVSNPFLNKYTLFVPFNLDIEKIKEASNLLLGTHDFNAFRAENLLVKNTVRTIHDININKDGNLILIEITGDGFLYNMVRIIVGTMIKIGSNKKEKTCIEEALNTGNRQLLGHTVKPNGLFLKKVYYKILDTHGSML